MIACEGTISREGGVVPHTVMASCELVICGWRISDLGITCTERTIKILSAITLIRIILLPLKTNINSGWLAAFYSRVFSGCPGVHEGSSPSIWRHILLVNSMCCALSTWCIHSINWSTVPQRVSVMNIAVKPIWQNCKIEVNVCNYYNKVCLEWSPWEQDCHYRQVSGL